MTSALCVQGGFDAKAAGKASSYYYGAATDSKADSAVSGYTVGGKVDAAATSYAAGDEDGSYSYSDSTAKAKVCASLWSRMAKSSLILGPAWIPR